MEDMALRACSGAGTCGAGRVCGLPLLFLGNVARRGGGLDFRRKEVKGGRGALLIQKWPLQIVDADEMFVGS